MEFDLKKFFIACKEYLEIDFTEIEEYIELINTYFPNNQKEINIMVFLNLQSDLGREEISPLYYLYSTIADKCCSELDLESLSNYGNSFEIGDNDLQTLKSKLKEYPSGSLMNQKIKFILDNI